MNIKKLLSLSCALPLALAPAKVLAQAPAPANPQGSINAVIGSNSGKQRWLGGHPGYIGRAGLRAGQNVKVTLQCPGAQSGDLVMVMSLDGGKVIQAEQALRVGPDGSAAFQYQGASSPGLYRVLVRVGDQEQLLEFYVLDTEHPGNNPPRIRIVD